MEDALPHVYVTGHKNPDTDTIASAIGYTEYKNLVDPENHYVAARLGEVNAQTGWALKKSGAEKPGLLEHIMLRVKDVMAGDVAVARKNDPLRNVGITMARRNISQLPIVEEDGSLTGIITERNLARMYVRESRGLPLSPRVLSRSGRWSRCSRASFWSGRKTVSPRASCGLSR